MPDRPKRISVAEALRLIRENCLKLGNEIIAADANAAGRTLSAPILAASSAPRFDCAAMDGFAVVAQSVAAASPHSPIDLELAPALPAGSEPRQIEIRRPVPISTGAKIPPGADAVLEREAVSVKGDRVIFTAPVRTGRNIRRAGEDIAEGQLVGASGTRITPDLLGAILNSGIASFEVCRVPSIAVLSTGNEIASLGQVDGALRADSNGPMIAAMCGELGLNCRYTGAVNDDRGEIGQVFEELVASSNDIIITTGGVSAGTSDLVREVLVSMGAQIWFHGIAMRPGKPLLFATLPDGRPWFGLPGNSIAAFVGFRFFVMAGVRRMLGLDPEVGAPINVPDRSRPGVSLFLRATRSGPSGIDLDLDQRSHVFSSLLRADCWVQIDPDSLGSNQALLFEKYPAPLR